MLKKVFALIISTAICLSLFSGCGESAVGEAQTEEETTSATIAAQTSNEISLTEITTEATTTITTETTLEITTEATSETTIEATVTAEETTTERELTADEVELMNSMPDIVFVLSHCYYDTNILGFFVEKDGNVKLYDFRDREPEKYYNVLDVLDELETVVCPEIELSGSVLKPENLKISEVQMIEYYKILMQIDKNSEIINCENPTDSVDGYGELYGIRNNENGEREIITLTGWGDFYDFNSDPLAEEITPFKLFGLNYSLSYYSKRHK
ncbi:MAG: hypothetical protein ACI4J6_05680 [Oscillospiraceae bacterium]